jgi:hypothetical protein
MHRIQIDASPHQLRKLRKGHAVRVKKGEGFELLVHPNTFNLVTRSFNKNKGAQLKLSPEELKANNVEPEEPKEEEDAINMNTMFGQGIHKRTANIKLADELNHHLGSNYGYLARAGMDNAINGMKSAALSKHGIDARYQLAPKQTPNSLMGPHSRMIGGRIEKSTVGLKGSMLHAYTPPALVSQPFSANFQFQHFLPPQYQHFNAGGHDVTGNGLYI